MTHFVSRERQGLDALLAAYPGADVVSVSRDPAVFAPWTRLELRTGATVEPFAIWRSTGNVYVVGPDGAVEDDPCIVVTTI